jgi:hypothetical protein
MLVIRVLFLLNAVLAIAILHLISKTEVPKTFMNMKMEKYSQSPRLKFYPTQNFRRKHFYKYKYNRID